MISTTPSSTRSDRSTSAAKSACPGVSMRLTVRSFSCNDTTADLMVMPRARSSSIVSVCVVPLSTLPTDGMTPVSKRIRSVRLVLPASTCARMPSVTTAMRHTFVEAASDRWTLQRLPHGRLLCQCAHRSDSGRPPHDALRCDARRTRRTRRHHGIRSTQESGAGARRTGQRLRGPVLSLFLPR